MPKKKETPAKATLEIALPGCPKCGYPHAAPPKCRACGAEITEEATMVEEPSEEVEEETPEEE